MTPDYPLMQSAASPRNPWPKIRFYDGADGRPWKETALAPAGGCFLADPIEVVQRPASAEDAETYPEAWQEYQESRAPVRRAKERQP